MAPDTDSRPQRPTNGQGTWRARCIERCRPGLAGGQKPTGANPGKALRSDPPGSLRLGRGPRRPTVILGWVIHESVADEQFGRWVRTLRAILMAEMSVVVRTCTEESCGVR